MVSSLPHESPLHPVRPYGRANEAIQLYEGPIGVAGADPRRGRIELTCCPSPQIRWQIEPSGKSEYIDPGPVVLVVTRDDQVLEIKGHMGGDWAGWINGVRLGDAGARLRRLQTQWMNLPNITGPVGLAQTDGSGTRSYWRGRWLAEIDGWRITLDSRPDLSKATADAQVERLFVLTHTMEVRRVDDTDFTAAQAEQLLEHLRVTFSFAFGYWASYVLPQGYDADGKVVSETWFSPICDPARRVPPAWLYPGRPADLTELVSRALPALADPARQGTTRLQMLLAVSAVENGFVEQRILAASPGLENLGWTRLVHTGDWSADDYKNRYAEDRLRFLLQEARIPTDIDPEAFPALTSFAAPTRLDGPTAVTQIRNRLVHPQLQDGQVNSGERFVQDAWLLLRRYLTLLILHDIGYRGSVVDPGKLSGWAGDAIRVPWQDVAPGAPPPPMPPDKRVIRQARQRVRWRRRDERA